MSFLSKIQRVVFLTHCLMLVIPHKPVLVRAEAIPASKSTIKVTPRWAYRVDG